MNDLVMKKMRELGKVMIAMSYIQRKSDFSESANLRVMQIRSSMTNIAANPLLLGKVSKYE